MIERAVILGIFTGGPVFIKSMKFIKILCGLEMVIGIKHGFSCIFIRQVPWEVLKTEAEGRSFQHLQRDLANVNALKNHVRLHKILLHKI